MVSVETLRPLERVDVLVTGSAATVTGCTAARFLASDWIFSGYSSATNGRGGIWGGGERGGLTGLRTLGTGGRAMARERMREAGMLGSGGGGVGVQGEGEYIKETSCRDGESRAALMPHSPRVAPPAISPAPRPLLHPYTMSGIFAQPYPSDSLHFYAGQPYDARQPQPPYAGAMGSMGSMSGSMNMATGNILAGSGRWWEAFGTGGLDGEPSLMEGASPRLHPHADRTQSSASTHHTSSKSHWLSSTPPPGSTPISWTMQTSPGPLYSALHSHSSFCS